VQGQKRRMPNGVRMKKTAPGECPERPQTMKAFNLWMDKREG
jgi:hypothetical protein